MSQVIFRAALRALSPLATPLHSDTLFGHLCWGIRYRQGEEALESFLAAFDSAEPPIAFSDAFPTGWLPRPALEPDPPDLETIEDYRDIKKADSSPFIPAEWLLTEDSVSVSKIRESMRGIFREGKGAPMPGQRVVRLHNTINRITGTTGPEGGDLYSSEEAWHGPDARFDLYIASAKEQGTVSDWLEWTFENGFGADKSSGRGHIKVLSVEQIEVPSKGNRGMALGAFVPQPGRCRNLLGSVRVKFGKLGGHFASERNPATGTLRPFKKPAILFAPGSTFENEDPKPIEGRLLSDVHPDSRIRHCALSPVILIDERRAP